MKKTIAILFAASLLAAASAFGAATNYAQRIDCDIQSAGENKLPDIQWIKGSTPILEVRALRNGKLVNADTGTICRIQFASTLTNTSYAVVSNYWPVTNASSYWLQLGTVGTNASNWVYAIFMLRSTDGYVYWSGSGRLDIVDSTALGDGLTWVGATGLTHIAWANVTGKPLFAGSGTTGLITSAAGDAGKYLKADGSWGASSAEDATARADALGAWATASNALPASATNGWEVGSHSALASTSYVANALSSYLPLSAGSNNALTGNLYSTNAYVSRAVTLSDVSVNGISRGARQSVDYSGLFSLITITNGRGANQSVWGSGNSTTAKVSSAGVVQNLIIFGGENYAEATGYNSQQFGYMINNSTAKNNGACGLQLFVLSNQTAETTGDGHASILLGAGVSSNKNAIVAGDGQVSHGDGSISAASFWANGTNLLGMGFLTAATFTVAEGEENSWDGTNTLTIKTNYAAGSGFPLTEDGDLAGHSLTNGSFVGDGSGLTGVVAAVTSGVSTVNGLDGAVVLAGAGINQITTNESTLTITGTEADSVFIAWRTNVAANTTNAIKPDGSLVDISSLLGGGITAETATNIAEAVVGGWVFDGFRVATPAIVTDGAAYLWAESNAWWTLDVTGANTLTAAVPWVISTNGLAVGEIPALAVKVALADSETNTWSWGKILTNSVTTPTAGSTNLFMLWWNGAAWVAY